MTQHRERGSQVGLGSAPVRVGSVAVLLVLAVVAARARSAAELPRIVGPTGGMVIDTIRTLGVAVVTTGLVLLVWGRWTRRVRLASAATGQRPPRTLAQRRRLIVAALVGALVALGIQLLMQTVEPPEAPPPSAPNQPIAPPAVSGLGMENIQPHDMPQAGLGSYLSAVAVLAALVALAVVLLRRDEVIEPAKGERLEPAETVVRAMTAGQAAMRGAGAVDARHAIVACFAAMEDALAGLGADTAPRPADTPEEVLRRGLAGTSLPERPARELLELFHEARFSRHPMRESHRRTADQALTAILAALADDLARPR